MRKYFCMAMALLAGSFHIATVSGQETPSDPARVMFFGVFHFKDAGKDVVQVEDIDIFSDENQAYLDSLTTRLAEFEPTVVLLEYNPENEDGMNQRYRDYVDGDYALEANEIYQLGFRIAKKAGLERVYSFDHRDLHWQGQALFDYAEIHNPPEVNAMRTAIKSVEAEEAQARHTLSLAQLLARQNSPEQEELNMDLYLLTNPVGIENGWVGADATSSWWARNFRMYARVQRHATPGARVIAIAGTGHTAILKQLLDIDQRIEAEDPLPYIKAQPSP